MMNANISQSRASFPKAASNSAGRQPLVRPVAVFSILLLAAVGGLAQEDPNDSNNRAYTVNAGGGATPITGSEHAQLNAGWNFQSGAGFRCHGIYIGGDFLFGDLGVKSSALQSASASNPTNIPVEEATGGRAKFYMATGNVTYRFVSHTLVGPYLFGGFGWMRRDIQLTGSNGGNSLIEPNNPVLLGTGGDSAAFDGGGGLNFRPWHEHGPHPTFYAEVRVVHGLGANKSATLIPISGGIRW